MTLSSSGNWFDDYCTNFSSFVSLLVELPYVLLSLRELMYCVLAGSLDRKRYFSTKRTHVLKLFHGLHYLMLASQLPQLLNMGMGDLFIHY